MTKEELKTILENHKHWLEEDCTVWEGMKANLRYANLSNADLRNANLSNADLSNAKLDARGLYVPYSCPDFGVFIGWKKCKRQVPNIGEESVLVQLEIPEDAKRLSATGRKCRCDKAKVIRITNLDGTEEYETACSDYNNSFTYKVGETVSVDNFDENRWNECSTGIHFFINRQEAVNY